MNVLDVLGFDFKPMIRIIGIVENVLNVCSVLKTSVIVFW